MRDEQRMAGQAICLIDGPGGDVMSTRCWRELVTARRLVRDHHVGYNIYRDKAEYDRAVAIGEVLSYLLARQLGQSNLWWLNAADGAVTWGISDNGYNFPEDES